MRTVRSGRMSVSITRRPRLLSRPHRTSVSLAPVSLERGRWRMRFARPQVSSSRRDTQRRPTRGADRAAGDRVEQPGGVAHRIAGHAPVARDGAHGAAGRERDRRQRPHAERSRERAHAGHVRAVAAGEDDRFRSIAASARRQRARDVVELAPATWSRRSRSRDGRGGARRAAPRPLRGVGRHARATGATRRFGSRRQTRATLVALLAPRREDTLALTP